MSELLTFLDSINFQSESSRFKIEEISFTLKVEGLQTFSKGIEVNQQATIEFESNEKFESSLRSTFLDLLRENDDKEMFSNSLTKAFMFQDNLQRCLDIANLEYFELLDHIQPKIKIFFLVEDILTDRKRTKLLSIEEILFFAKELNVNQKFSIDY